MAVAGAPGPHLEPWIASTAAAAHVATVPQRKVPDWPDMWMLTDSRWQRWRAWPDAWSVVQAELVPLMSAQHPLGK